MRALLLIFVLVMGSRLSAAPPEMRLPGAVSTKLDRELVLMPKPDEPYEPNAVSIAVRHAKSHRMIASDTFIPFGRISDTDPRMRVAWSPTGEYVAINLRGTRHDITTFVYRVTSTGLIAIEIPFYWSKARKILGAEADASGGIETPLRWLNDYTLVVQSRGSLRDETGYDLLVTIAFKNAVPTIVSVEPNK